MSTTELATQEMGGDQVRAVAQLPPDMMLLKMENESIMAVAKAAPRDPAKIVKQLQQLIDAYPAAADDAIYRKPVGTVMEITCECGIKYEVNIKWNNRKATAEPEPCPTCGEWRPKGQKQVKKFAEGLSARAAESIRSVFGYTRLATTTEMLEDGKARITGVLVDYAAGNITSDERIVSPFYRSRNGQMQRIAEDRFLNLTVKSEISKLRRDVILLSTPNIIKACFQDSCEQKILGLVAPELIEQKIIPAFAAYGITAADLDRLIGSPHALGWKDQQRLECRKLLAALKSEETTARELLDGLRDAESTQSAPQQPSAGATMDDLTKPQSKVETTSPGQRESGEEDEPIPAATDEEATTVAQWCEEIAGMSNLEELAESKRSIPQTLSNQGQFKILEAIQTRETDLRAGHGKQSKSKKMF